MDAEANERRKHVLHTGTEADPAHTPAGEPLEPTHRHYREEKLKYLRTRILEYRVGAFSSFLHQPLVQTLLLVISGIIIYLVDLAGV